MSKETKQAARPLSTIAADIAATWPKVNYAAAPYLDAMASLNSVDEMYLYQNGKSIVLYFLSNAGTYRGPDAKRIKAELKALL
tara:strand:- start:349 stop:597 length:249 start_codon:yes stop_codon:yes gene_type:complete